ncbi:MAG TPA: SMC-Scp complex subunit ScpB [Gemmataceae bacterium]|jgi:segregation and condensation protein B
MSDQPPDTPGSSYAAALQPRDGGAEPDVPPPLGRIVEALLFAGGQPLTPDRAAAVVRGLAPDHVRELVEELNRTYRRQGRPYAIQSTEQGYVLALRPRYRAVAERLHGGPREARLSRAAVEVLSLIAFRQPVTRAEIDGQRGTDSAALVRQLVRLGLVAVLPGDGREAAYGTTARFLELFGLQSLDDLPQTLDLQQI